MYEVTTRYRSIIFQANRIVNFWNKGYESMIKDFKSFPVLKNSEMTSKILLLISNQ